jgi:hypothetical protein
VASSRQATLEEFVLKPRPNIHPDTVAELMFQNRHTCCVCRTPRKHVQIHHKDEDTSNNNPENLAVVCVDCHSLITADQGFGRKYTAREIVLFKTNWEAQCAVFHNPPVGDDAEDEEEDEDDAEEPADSYYTDTILPAESHIDRHYILEEGDEIKLWIDSDERLEVIIMTTRNYNLWAEDEEDDRLKFLEYHDDQYELSTSYTVPKDGKYTVVVCNHTEEDADLQLDISIWE